MRLFKPGVQVTQVREVLGFRVPNLVFDIVTLRGNQYYSNIETKFAGHFTWTLTHSSDRIAEEMNITC